MAITRLTKLQSGKETTWGTAVAATAKWQAMTERPTAKAVIQQEPLPEFRGSLQPVFSGYTPRKMAEWALGGWGSYEDLVLYLASAVQGGVTPVAQNPPTNSVWLWTFNAPTTTAWQPQSWTFELGHDLDVVKLSGCLATKLGFKAAANSHMTWRLEGFSKAPQYGQTFTPSIADRVVTPVVANLGTLTMTDPASPPATILYSSTLRDFSLDIETGLHPKWFQTGSLDVSGFGYGDWKLTASMVVEYNATVKSALANLLDTGKVVQVVAKWTGPTITGSYPYYVQFRLYGILTDAVPLWEDAEGNVTTALKFQGIYDATGGMTFQAQVQNTVQALP